jgi:hypothetical protein
MKSRGDEYIAFVKIIGPTHVNDFRRTCGPKAGKQLGWGN